MSGSLFSLFANPNVSMMAIVSIELFQSCLLLEPGCSFKESFDVSRWLILRISVVAFEVLIKLCSVIFRPLRHVSLWSDTDTVKLFELFKCNILNTAKKLWTVEAIFCFGIDYGFTVLFAIVQLVLVQSIQIVICPETIYSWLNVLVH